jgi:hypothetical protein
MSTPDWPSTRNVSSRPRMCPVITSNTSRKLITRSCTAIWSCFFEPESSSCAALVLKFEERSRASEPVQNMFDSHLHASGLGNTVKRHAPSILEVTFRILFCLFYEFRCLSCILLDRSDHIETKQIRTKRNDYYSTSRTLPPSTNTILDKKKKTKKQKIKECIHHHVARLGRRPLC